jgi:hypothetical protein
MSMGCTLMVTYSETEITENWPSVTQGQHEWLNWNKDKTKQKTPLNHVNCTHCINLYFPRNRVRSNPSVVKQHDEIKSSCLTMGDNLNIKIGQLDIPRIIGVLITQWGI